MYLKNDLFHIIGGLGILWSGIWLFFASDTPITNTHISSEEKEYIQTCKTAEKIQDSRTVSNEGKNNSI